MPTLDWIGKQAVLHHHRDVPYRLIHCDKDLSAGDPDAGNLLVQGDNLEALKALLPYYAGKVKCIYIDPPYNTGNEGWIYNDNVNSPEMKKWLGQVVGKEAEDLSRHDKWLCMMYPRLRLLREFLSEDGAIFVSIDDNEVHHLRILMDEIFGSNSMISNIVWQKKYSTSNDHKSIAPMHDHILAFQRSAQWQRNLVARTETKDRQYRFEDENGVFRTSDYTCNKNAEERPKLFYPIEHPKTKEPIWPKRSRVWAYEQTRHQKNVELGLVYWGADGNASVPSFKRYRDTLKTGNGTVPQTWWPHDLAGHNDEARKELRSIMELSNIEIDFATPKPTRLLKLILQIASNPNDIILDSFAGSGTTGHAVLDLNKQDGGNRKFICVEMDRKIASDVTAERLKRVINGYDKTKGDKSEHVEGLGSGFRFCRLGTPLFDEFGGIAPEVTYADLAAHIFFSETGSPIPQKPDPATTLLGTFQSRAIYLLYDAETQGFALEAAGNTLTPDMLAKLPLPEPEFDGLRVVYAEGCTVSADRLRDDKISFKQIPYQIGGA